MEKVTADVVETARELELDIDPEDGTESLPLLIKLECMRSPLLTDERRKWCLEAELWICW